MTNIDIAKVFNSIADLLEIKEDSIFKIRAYRKAARAIELYTKDLETMVKSGESLRAITGVGEALAKKIVELVTTGSLGYYENLKAEFPAGTTNLLAISGAGPRVTNRLSRDLGTTSVEEVEHALNDVQAS